MDAGTAWKVCFQRGKGIDRKATRGPEKGRNIEGKNLITIGFTSEKGQMKLLIS